MKKLLFITLLALLAAGRTAWADDVIVKYYDPTAAIGAQRKTVTNPVQITTETTAIGTADTETWYYVSGEFTNSNRIEVSGTVNLILADGCNFTASRGIHVPSGSALNIYAQSVANRGSLTADNYVNDAAIGGNGGEPRDGDGTPGESAGDITIYGGTITTYGNIGGGDGGNGAKEPGESFDEPGNGGNGGNGNVTIYSGCIRVNGNIGGGSGGTGQNDYGIEEEYYYGSNGGGTVNLSWTNTEDWICADNYYGTVTLQKDFNGFAKGEVSNNNDINGATLMYAGTYYIVTIGDMPVGVTATADLELNAGFKDAVEGQVVTIGFSGVPEGKILVLSISYTYGEDPQFAYAIDNGDGTYSFTMPDANVIITAVLKKDFTKCTATVDNQELSANSNFGPMGWDNIIYKFETAEYPEMGVSVGEVVKDGETLLTLGTDYRFGSVEYVTGDGSKAGDECRVEIVGQGDYAGSKWVDFTIIGPEVSNQTWGNNNELTWSLSNGELSISLTTPANGSKSMPETNREGYPWHAYGSYITSITIGEGVLDVAANAFAGTQGVNTYGSVTTVSLPSTLTHIGDYAFAYCTGLSIDLDNLPVQTTFGLNPFNQIKQITGTLSADADNTKRISLMAGAQTANVTVYLTLYKKKWNTLCLPFDVSDLAGVSATVNIMELDTNGYSNGSKRLVYTNGKYYDGDQVYDGSLANFHQTGYSDGKYYVNFKEATSIEASKPYLVHIDDDDDILGLTFNGVHATSLRTDAVSEDGKVRFVGNYVQGALSTAGDTFVWDSSGGKFAVPTTSNLDAFEAYIQLTDASLGDAVVSVSDPATVNQFVLNGTLAPRNLNLTGHLHDGSYWTTFYSGSDCYLLPEGATAYTMDNSKHLYRLGTNGRTVPKNTAVVIIADQSVITLTASSANPEVTIHSTGNILHGSDSPVTVSGLGGTPYVLGVVNSVFGFHQYTGASIPANKAYYVE